MIRVRRLALIGPEEVAETLWDDHVTGPGSVRTGSGFRSETLTVNQSVRNEAGTGFWFWSRFCCDQVFDPEPRSRTDGQVGHTDDDDEGGFSLSAVGLFFPSVCRPGSGSGLLADPVLVQVFMWTQFGSACRPGSGLGVSSWFKSV